MNFITIIILTFFISPMILNAANIYVKIGNTKSFNQLKNVESKLNSLGLKIYYKRTPTKYILYSGPYKNLKSATYAAKKIKRHYKYARVLRLKKTTAISKPEKTEIQTNQTEPKQQPIQYAGRFYLGTSIGYFSALSNHSIEEGTVIPNTPKNSGVSYGINCGYVFNNNFSVALNYMKFNANDILFTNFYGELNYSFDTYNNFTPYFGVLAGGSSLTWNSDPIDNTSEDSNSDSTSLLGGTQAGLIYYASQNVALTLNYQCLFMGHTTEIDDSKGDITNKSSLEHNTLHSIQIGVQYYF